jgi:hypothetical protein
VCKRYVYAVRKPPGEHGAVVVERAVTDELIAIERLFAASIEAVLRGVETALSGLRSAEDALQTAIDTARDAGCTWQQIGDVIGVSRQGAFQRFGRPKDPRTGREMEPQPDADQHALTIFSSYVTGNWETVTRAFNPQMKAALTPEQLGAGLAQIVGAIGEFEHLGAPVAHQRGDLTVVDVPMEFEAGTLKGRVTFGADGLVAGLFLLNPEVM